MRQPVSASARAALALPRAVAQQEEQGVPASADVTASRYDSARRSIFARALAAVVAVITWCGPVQISWQAARQSAATIATHGTSSLDVLAEQHASWLTTGRLLLHWGMQQAQAGAITDPTAPIRFTPTLTQTTGAGGGVPVINITTPNAAGLSNNVLRSLTVDPIGLVLNNSLTGGGTFLGGNVGGNANLATSGPASTILTQVTGTDPIRVNGTVEVFGAPASVIFAAPAGIYTQGAGFTNTPRVTLSTGAPQFLNGSGANVGFDQATAIGFLVSSGRIQIDPVAGTTNGAGIEGTVGAVNLIGQTVGVNAPLYAGDQINVIAGNQQVAPVAAGTGRAGSDWQVTSTGQNNAANSPTAQNGLAIDATAFGAMTAGQIKLISTAQGLGVRAAGDLAANTSNVNIDANGNVNVGNVYGQQSVGVTSAGAVSTSGTVKAQQDVSVSADGDVNVGGATQAGKNLTLNAGGSLTGAGNLGAGQALSATAGNSVNLTGSLNATNLSVSAQGKDGTGDIALGGNVSSPNTITLNAARDLSTAGPVTTNGDLQATAGRDISIAGAAQSSGATVLNAARNIGVSGTGSVVAGTTTTATAGQNLNVNGTVASQGNLQLATANGAIAATGTLASNGTITAIAGGTTGDISLSGTVSSPGAVTLTAARNATVGGQLATGGNLQVTAGQDASVTGTAQSTGATTLSGTRDVSVGSVGSVTSGTTLSATAGRNVNVSGGTASGGDTALTATSGTLSTSGAVLSNGNVTANGQTGTTLGGTVYAAQGVSAQSGAGTTSATGTVIAHSGNVALTGTNVAVSGSTQSATDTTLNATQGNASVDGQVVALGKLTATASQDIVGQGSTASVGDTNLSAGRNIALTGSSQAAGNLTATAANNVAIAELPVVGGNATVSGANVSLGSAGKTSQVNGTLAVTGTQSVATAGAINTASANLTGGTVTNAGTVTASNALTAAGTTITNTGTLGGAATTVHGTDVKNAGLIGGQTVNVTADNALNNQDGTLLGTQALNITANALTSNQNGVMFAGSPSGTAAGGDLTTTVKGGNGSFNNAGGQILAANNATLNLQNQTVDGATLGTINAGNQLTYNVGALANTGAWTVGGKSATVNAANGISNTGSIQHAGDLTLSTPGAVSNSGQIIAGNNLTVAGGTISNAAGATLHADNDVSVTGSTTNRGTVEALNDVNIAGAGYDNAGALTQANRDVNVNVSGNVLNQGGTIGARRDVNITASQVVNDATAPTGAGTTVVTGQEVNPTYLSQIVIGQKQVQLIVPGSSSTQDGPAYGPYYFPLTIGDLKPDANGVISGYQAIENWMPSGGGGDNGPTAQALNLWHFGSPSLITNPTNNYQPVTGSSSPFITLPTVTRTETTTQDGVSGIIQAGRDLVVTASALSNNGGQMSAARNIQMAVSTLNNGTSAGLTKTITESIDPGTVNAFMQQLAAQLGWNSFTGETPLGVVNEACISTECIPQQGQAGPHWFWLGPAAFGMNGPVGPGSLSGFTATAPAPQVTVQQVAGKQGVIAAGGNIDLTQVGTLNNGGQIAAAGNITLAGSVNNVGQLNVNRTTLPGCVGNPTTCSDPGVSGGGSAYHEVIDPKQQAASIVAGGTLTANLSQLTNQTGTIAAAGNVQITAPTVTNTGATIQSTAGSVSINAANGLVNQAAPTTTVYASHGSDVAPCGKAGSGTCATATQSATGDAGMILAAGDLTINAGSVRNNGGAIVAGGNNTITTGSFDNSSVFLRQYYHWSFYDQNSNASDRWGCDSAGDISGCQRVFGSNLTNGTNANAENAPTIGQLSSYVSGGNLAIRSGGALVNSGNIEGTAISLSGATITNGITNPSIQTPPSTSGQQVVSLGPIGTPNAQLPVTGTPDTFSGPTTVLQKGVPNPTNPGTSNGQFQFNPVVVTNQTGGVPNWHFNAPLSGSPLTSPTTGSTAQFLTSSPATAVLGGVGPATLINALPADLRPGSTPFYYDPQAENARLDQQALVTTGRTTFINGLTYDNQNHLSVDDQEKLILYQNAVDYAKAHNIQLGQALTPDQLAALDKPMLWYVTQQVPDPNCMSGACPMVSALVPQVYLPPGYSGIEPGGSIVASKSLDLIANNPIQNTGTLGSYGTLTTNTTIVNEQRSAEMTAAWQPIEDGWARTTGQQGQPNSGFMFAANAADIAGQVQNINGVLAQLNADGSMSAEESARVAAAIQAGRQAVTETHTDTYVRPTDWAGQIFAGVVMVMLAVMSGGALGPVLAGLSGGMVSATVAGAAAGAMVSSAGSQLAANDSINFGKLFTAGATAAVTAGIANGISVNADGSLGIAEHFGQGNTLANVAGAQNIAGTNLAQAGVSNAGNYLQQAEAILVLSGATAAVNTVVSGGSFGRAFLNSLASNAGAAAANALGSASPGINEVNATPGTIAGNILGHVALGCAISAMQGTGCAGGAAGGLSGAIAAPLIGSALYAGTDGSSNPALDMLTVQLTGLAGGALAHAIGGNETAGLTTGENAAQNNWLNHRRPSTIVYSEQERYDNAAAACAKDPASSQCQVRDDLAAKSKLRDDELRSACFDRSSNACRNAMDQARAGGNVFGYAKGTVFAYGPNDPGIRSLDPSPAAVTLGTMTMFPAAGIFGSLPYYGSNPDPAAGYYGAQYGMVLDGLFSPALGLRTPLSSGAGSLPGAGRPGIIDTGSNQLVLANSTNPYATGSGNSSGGGPLYNGSGDLNGAANAARTQPYGNGASASPSPGPDAAGSSGANIQWPTATDGSVQAARQRQVGMLDSNTGFNVSPIGWDSYPTIGRNGTYVTDQRAILNITGALNLGGETVISKAQAIQLEQSMGLQPGSLADGFKVRQVDGISGMSPRSPMEGNQYFLGPGQHLPGGGPEMVIDSISTTDSANVRTLTTVKVR
ncbi:two-partner secretion domain-containing protein [Ralstonia sp. 25C]|uniref:two-partner secretion domain-containing protein n=1 Tax=Ralstonia sp. 25C TaxID=3447363 RepID=UPI003F75045C